MTIARLVESGYPRPYACALVAAGACTGILIPPSIAYIIIGLVLGISASTLFLAALIPGLAILFAILVTNLIVNRIYAYESGGNLTFTEWASNLGRSLKSAPLAEALAIMGVPQGFVTSVTGLTDEPWILILLMIGILIAAGCVMETTPNIVILAPILKPLADNIGMNEIQFCIMMITALGVGFITPPLGLNLFVVAGITGESILKIAARAVPFVLCMFIVVLFIAYIPAISTTLLPEIYK